MALDFDIQYPTIVRMEKPTLPLAVALQASANPNAARPLRMGEWLSRAGGTLSRPGVGAGVEVGVDITPEQLSAEFDAVVYAVGADRDRALPLGDEAAPVSARLLVGWYTGHPDVAADAIDLGGVERVVVIGNGNVALDAARILTADVDDLVGTDISPHALAALRNSSVSEVTVLGRRGPEFAAFTRSECQALVSRSSVPVFVDGPDDILSTLGSLPMSASASPLAAAPVAPATSGTPRRIVFSFGRTPVAIRHDGGVRGLGVRDADGTRTIAADLILQATGYRGSPLPGLPFDEDRGTVRNVDGRVIGEDGEPLAGAYVVGWAKRGASGGIGDNKADAERTVDLLLADALAGSSTTASTTRRSVFRRPARK